eukprot:GHVO01026717.1.p1 GENE.GHVO01026717.1~~GHVO01026717.1.p1  ORF type:complete len:160 (-),score=8.30 GHVO01026717.1:6-485(-)
MSSLPSAALDGYASAKAVCSPYVTPMCCIGRSEVLQAQDLWSSYTMKMALLNEVSSEMKRGGKVHSVTPSEWTRRIFAHLTESLHRRKLTTICGAKNLFEFKDFNGNSHTELLHAQMEWFLDALQPLLPPLHFTMPARLRLFLYTLLLFFIVIICFYVL